MKNQKPVEESCFTIVTMLAFLFLSVSNLKVSGVSFPTVSTTLFNIAWIAPSGFETFVDYYRVQFRQNINDLGQTTTPITSTSTTISPVTPGVRYYINVYSVNTRTDSSSIRSTAVSTEQSASKFD